MPIKLITGATGDGKSHLAMKMLIEQVAKGRPCYTNIEGCILEGVDPIPMNDRGELDWQLTHRGDEERGLPGAFVVYDETQKLRDNQKVRYFAYVSRQKLSDRDVISELDYHRHYGYDIVFLTQNPELLHPHLLGFVKEHYHCSRPMNKKQSQVAFWRSIEHKPNSEAALKRAEDVYVEDFDDKVFKLYKSTDVMTDDKTRIPKYIKRLWWIVGIIFSLILLYLVFGNSPFFKASTYKAAVGNKDAQKEISQQFSSKDTQSSPQDLSIECRKAENLNTDQCKQFLTNLGQTNGSLSPLQQDQINYNPSKPYDVQAKLNYQVKQRPVFSGCMKSNGRYVAYTQQGTILHDVSQDDCKRLIEHDDRPFNYFKEPERQMVARNVERDNISSTQIANQVSNLNSISTDAIQSQ